MWDFKRDEIVNNGDVTDDNNAPSFKYKVSIIGITDDDGRRKGVKIAVPLKYLSNFWRLLKMPLINFKVEPSLNLIKICLLTVANTAIFKITDAKLYVPIVTLSAEDNAKLSKLLSEGLKRSIYWNKYKVIKNIVEITANNEEKTIRELLDSSRQGVKRLFFLTYNNRAGNAQVSVDSYKKYLLPRVKIESFNNEIDGGNFYDRPISDSIKQYNEISTVQAYDYTTGCLLDLAYFEKIYRLVAGDWSKQKTLDADPKAIQQIIFTGYTTSAAFNTRVIIYYIFEQSKETILEFAKGATKVF